MLRCGECGSMIQPPWTNNHGRQYPYYTCSKRIKAGYNKCKLPTLPAGEIEALVVDQLRMLFRHPDVIARTYREVQELSETGPNQEATNRLAELRQRRDQIQDSMRAVLSLGNQNGFMAAEPKRLNGELNSLDQSISQLEPESMDTEPIELADVTDALQRVDPIWEILHPEEQRRVLELLVETITVSNDNWTSAFVPTGLSRSSKNWS